MFLSNTALEADKEIIPELRRWATKVNSIAANEEAPVFSIKETVCLDVRTRVGKRATESIEFGAGEQPFILGKITFEKRIERDGVELLVMFKPSPLMASDIQGLTLPLDRVHQVFQGFSEWTDELAANSAAVTPKAKSKDKPGSIALPTVEETRAGEVWGSW